MKISEKSYLCLTPTTLWKELQQLGSGVYYIIVDKDLDIHNKPTSIKIMKR